MTNFLNAIKEETTVTTTENGAKTYSSTLNHNLDFFSQAGAMRSRIEDVPRLFLKAFSEDNELALRNLVHLRNIRLGGLGERDTYRKALWALCTDHELVATKFLEYVAEIGRWDDLVYIYALACDNNRDHVRYAIVEIIQWNIVEDVAKKSKDEPVSLMCKWLPSTSSNSRSKRRIAEKLVKDLGFKNKKSYRKFLSEFRAYIGIVEQKLASKDYSNIKLETLPSKALFKYRLAFCRHMADEYLAFLVSVSEGKSVMNTSNVLPYEIVRAYGFDSFRPEDCKVNDHLELAWKSLDNVLEDVEDNAIVMADVSGSMGGNPMDVSVSLALYCAERLKGDYKDHFITFSSSPTLVHVPSDWTLLSRLKETYSADWGMSTNLYKAFELILNTALEHNLTQGDLPSKLIVVTDQEFDEATWLVDTAYWWMDKGEKPKEKTTLEEAKLLFESKGYKLPTVVFWNVDSRQPNVSARADEDNVVLVSGLTPNIFKQVLSKDITNPNKFMLDVLSTTNYDFVKECL